MCEEKAALHILHIPHFPHTARISRIAYKVYIVDFQYPIYVLPERKVPLYGSNVLLWNSQVEL